MMTHPPIAAAIERAHDLLMCDLQKLEETVAPNSDAGLPELRGRLAMSLTPMIEHFRLAERNGYLAEVKELEPRWESPVEHLHDEHRDLRQSLLALIAEASSAAAVDDDLRSKVRAWIERVHQHDQHEAHLVQDAFKLDIGGEA